MRRYLPFAALLALLLTITGLATAINVGPTAGARILADGSCAVSFRVNGTVGPYNAVDPAAYPVECAAALATATSVPPTATSIPPTATTVPGTCPGVDDMHWHPPVVNGCATGHEHGDEPPVWVNSSAWMPMYTHPGNTPNENVLKHTSFKGFALRDDNVDLYVIAHLDTNPAGHTSRFHSYQVWARDATGAVSHWDLWMDFNSGNATGPYLQPADNCGNDGHRPIMMVNFASGCPSVVFENWYSRAGAPVWGWDFGYNISPNYYGGPSKGVYTDGDLANIANWLPTGQLNTNRRVEMSFYANRGGPRGSFYSTQWGDIVSGPNDALCGTQRVYGAKSYTVLCIGQFISPSMTTVQFPSNSIQKVFPSQGVKNPN